MRALILVLALGLLLLCLLAQGLPWSGGARTTGHDPALVTKGVTVAFVMLALALVVFRLIQAAS